MIIIHNTILSDDFLDAHFVCDLPKCKGECCVSGDAGAPLEEEEISILEDEIGNIMPYMTEAGKAVIDRDGVFDYDEAGNFVTPLVNGREYAFTGFHSSGVSYCTIERAFNDGRTSLRKPLSCHLYPVRLSNKGGFTYVNYHRWSICNPARKLGVRSGTSLYKFLKEALIRKFGPEWYEQLEKEMQGRK
ncbi:MAG TPA: DUF3109 family protein [Bacteroidales bacterium]|nr:DUF3109 family protein [Bacteroidales bacterium]